METINNIHDKYGPGLGEETIEEKTKELIEKIKSIGIGQEILKKALSCIDLTTLNSVDNGETAKRFCANVNAFESKFPGLPNVAAICVYPSLLEKVKTNLKAAGVKKAVVGAGFPSSQTFLSVKLAECELLASKGADEIDIVISVGRFLEGDYQYVANEIRLIKEVIGDVHLKVILETGKLASAENIRIASLLAMESGADFIKTSTGKENPAATPEAVFVMAMAVKDYHAATGRKVGIKPAGGISTPEDAAIYLGIISEILGEEWTNPELFRIGASRLANNLLSEIIREKVEFF